MLNNRKKIFDDLLQMRTAGTAATGVTGKAATVDAALKIFDTGGGYTEGKWIIDVAYASLGSPSNVPNLAYIIELQGSNSATFATPIIKLDTARLVVNVSGTADGIPMTPSSTRNLATVPFRVIKPFQNDVNGTIYRYMRLWTKTSGGYTSGTPSVGIGSIVTGIDYTAFLSV
uniref:Uncharacterized protein n=1 Tax=viral metagenome TaxID=1070528 RepID=A0A6M3LG67_9ZZZZ